MSRRGETALWAAQRLTAVILAACVVVHLLTIIYAVRGGLSAAAILGRTRGSVPWAGGPKEVTLVADATACHARKGGAAGLQARSGSALIDAVAARTERGEHEKAAGDRDVLVEVDLLHHVLGFGCGPELVEEEGSHHGEGGHRDVRDAAELDDRLGRPRHGRGRLRGGRSPAAVVVTRSQRLTSPAWSATLPRVQPETKFAKLGGSRRTWPMSES